LSPDAKVIDVNVSLFRWPFRRVGTESPRELLAQLDKHAVAQAWVGSLEGLFQRDISGVNERLAAGCGESGGRLIPFGSINPTLPDWQEDLERCHQQWKMPGVRLHPAYHDYALDRPEFGELLAAATRLGLIVQLVVAMEDERTQHTVFRVPHVDLAPLANLLRPGATSKLLLLNAFRSARLEQAGNLAATRQVWFDIAMLEGMNRLPALVERVGPERVVFGSHWPLFHQQAAIAKLRESTLEGSVLERVRRANAAALVELGHRSD
jgi:predicted TIM-barrel fold metal-dependent hydrolase